MLPCASSITIKEHNGHQGYHALRTFNSMKWTLLMLSTELIPSTKKEERQWAELCLAILSYACFVTNKDITGTEKVFTSIYNMDKTLKTEEEQ